MQNTFVPPDHQPPSPGSALSLTAGLSAIELAGRIQTQLSGAKDYARWRRKSWGMFASLTHIIGLALSATATVILGLAALSGLAQWGFICSALVTTLGAVEPFFNWRSRWVSAEEALAEWYRIDADLEMYVANTAEDNLDRARLMQFYDEYSLVWDQFSSQWLDQRRARTPGGSA